MQYYFTPKTAPEIKLRAAKKRLPLYFIETHAPSLPGNNSDTSIAILRKYCVDRLTNGLFSQDGQEVIDEASLYGLVCYDVKPDAADLLDMTKDWRILLQSRKLALQ